MKIQLVCMIGFLTVFGCKGRTKLLKTEEDKTIYSIGLVLSKSFGNIQFSPAQVKQIEAGLEDGLAKQPLVEINEYGPRIKALLQKMSAEKNAH